MGEEVIVLRGKWLHLALCLAVPLGVGGLSALLTRGNMAAFAALQKPPLAPPGWLFPVVWSILFLLMGCASWRVLGSGGPEREIRRALGLYGVLLMLVALSVRLCGIHSFGVPYLAPVAPKRPHGPDILLRLSLRRQQHPMYYAQRGSWMKGKRSK